MIEKFLFKKIEDFGEKNILFLKKNDLQGDPYRWMIPRSSR